MLTVCHLAEKPQNINRNTENHDHKRGITSIKLALKERSPTVASVASTTSSHTLPWACIFAKKNSALLGGRGRYLKLEPCPPNALFFFSKMQAQKLRVAADCTCNGCYGWRSFL